MHGEKGVQFVCWREITEWNKNATLLLPIKFTVKKCATYLTHKYTQIYFWHLSRGCSISLSFWFWCRVSRVASRYWTHCRDGVGHWWPQDQQVVPIAYAVGTCAIAIFRTGTAGAAVSLDEAVATPASTPSAAEEWPSSMVWWGSGVFGVCDVPAPGAWCVWRSSCSLVWI